MIGQQPRGFELAPRQGRSSRPVSTVGDGLELNRLRWGFTLVKLTYRSPSSFNDLEDHEVRRDPPLSARVVCFQRDEEYFP